MRLNDDDFYFLFNLNNILMSLLDKGIELGHVHIDEEKKFITYKHAAKKYRFADPEELVRAEIYLQLIAEYNYKPSRISMRSKFRIVYLT
jgi:hypothetical protein